MRFVCSLPSTVQYKLDSGQDCREFGLIPLCMKRSLQEEQARKASLPSIAQEKAQRIFGHLSILKHIIITSPLLPRYMQFVCSLPSTVQYKLDSGQDCREFGLIPLCMKRSIQEEQARKASLPSIAQEKAQRIFGRLSILEHSIIITSPLLAAILSTVRVV
jgi:hypothetical protein